MKLQQHESYSEQLTNFVINFVFTFSTSFVSVTIIFAMIQQQQNNIIIMCAGYINYMSSHNAPIVLSIFFS